MAESYADELEEALREAELEALTLEAAASESGYSYSAIQKMVAGRILASRTLHLACAQGQRAGQSICVGSGGEAS